ncbi:uncharacterized protein LOC124326489 [Daphnia pulicaria]|uniref:uncharacterized protein LOC124326489 n=1 Tax=Daphnia pulicaria TaxID=35523 RepID=UPI001EE9E3A7|nr:uncharacterized protein LOC124326489 [Daphnia pulicaria]
MIFRPTTLCCFLLIVALATSAKIPQKNMHRHQSSIEENREKSARSGYLDSVPHSNELFLDEQDYLDDFSDDSLDWKEEDPEKNSKNLFKYLLNILSFEAKLEELMTNDKKIPSQEVSIVNMSGSGEDPDDDYWEDEDPIEELVIDEMHPVVTTTTEPPTTTEAVITTMITANENQLSGSCKSLANGNYLNPFDCKTFIYCFNGIAYILNCPTTLVSGVQWNWCDITREAQNLPSCN